MAALPRSRRIGIIVAVVVVVLFGRGKISGVMGEFASGIKAFQKGMRDDDKPEPMNTTAQVQSPPVATPSENAKDI